MEREIGDLYHFVCKRRLRSNYAENNARKSRRFFLKNVRSNSFGLLHLLKNDKASFPLLSCFITNAIRVASQSPTFRVIAIDPKKAEKTDRFVDELKIFHPKLVGHQFTLKQLQFLALQNPLKIRSILP